MADVKKCCVCCATTWIILATILVAIGIGTDFWYTGIFKMTYTSGGDETTYYRATTYGLEKFCAYPKNFNINAIIDGSAEAPKPKAKDITETKNWECVKWKKATITYDAYPTVSVDGQGKCKKGVDAGLGFGILGLLLTAPAALVCFLWCCCAESMMKCKTWANLGAIGLLFAVTFCYLLSSAIVAGNCSDFNKEQKAMLTTATSTAGSTTIVPLWSMCFVIVSIFFALFAAISFWRFHCSLNEGDAHNEEMAQEAQPAQVVYDNSQPNPVQGEASPPQMGGDNIDKPVESAGDAVNQA